MKQHLRSQISCPLTRFLDDHYHIVEGEYVPFAEFAADFRATLRDEQREAWDDDYRIIKELRFPVVVGRGPRNVKIVGNVSKHRQRPRRWISAPGNRVRLEP